MHDANGTELKVGDKVIIPCVVTALHTDGDDFCNVSVDSLTGRRPDNLKEHFGCINSGILVKISGTENPVGL